MYLCDVMKRFFVFLLILLAVVVGLLAVAPMAFTRQITDAVVRYAARDLDATLRFEDLSLSFLRSFPKARITLEGVSVTGKGAFEGDTLAWVKKAAVELNLRGVLSGRYVVSEVCLEEPRLNLVVNGEGKANWDIFLNEDKKEEEKEEDGDEMNLALEDVVIEDGELHYRDSVGGVMARIGRMNSRLSGVWSEGVSDMETENEWEGCDLRVGAVEWLKDVTVGLDGKAKAGEDRYELSENRLKVNDVEVSLVGDAKRVGEGDWKVDVTLDSREVKMKDLLSLVPNMYTEDFGSLDADGDVVVSGGARGDLRLDEAGDVKELPAWNVKVGIRNGWLKYAPLPKRMEDVNLLVEARGDGKNEDNSVVDVKRVAWRMGNNPFEGHLRMSHMAKRKTMDAAARGVIDMNELRDYVLLEDNSLSGVARVNVAIKGDYRDYEAGRYDKFAFDGTAELSDAVWRGGLRHPLRVDVAKVKAGSRVVDVEDLRLRYGHSDLQAVGHVDNLLAWLMRGETLRGTLETRSKLLQVEDLMEETEGNGDEAAEEKEGSKVVVLPSGFDVRMVSSFERVKYEKIDVSHARGTLHLLSDGTLKMQDVALNAMGGSMVLDGVYSTVDKERPRLTGDAEVRNVLYKEAFRQIESAHALLPIFGKTDGRFSGTMRFDVPMREDMTPNLNAVSAKGRLSSHNLTISDVEALHRLSKVLGRSELRDPEIKEVHIPYTIEEGKVKTDSFSCYIADTKLKVDKGMTGLDERIDYTLHVDVPTRESAVFKMSKMGVHIGGTFSQPEVKIVSRDMIKEAKQTVKENVAKVKESVKEEIAEDWKEQKNDMKESWSEGKDEMKQGLKEAGSEIKEAWKSLWR